MTFVISRIRFAVNKIAKKVYFNSKTLYFSRNKVSRGAGASPLHNPGASVLPPENVAAYRSPKHFWITCECSDCVHHRPAAPQVTKERPECDLAQVSARPPPPVIIVTPPTPPSTIRSVKRTEDRDLAQVSARPKSPPPAVIVTPPKTIRPYGSMNSRRSLTDDELFAQIEALCAAHVDRLCIRSGVVQEDPVSECLAPFIAKPVITTFVQPQPTLSVIMV